MTCCSARYIITASPFILEISWNLEYCV
uniref:Uncharacterized protein n=1 Tax=Arundo donax TaxID=35708 RepID=A0A0A9BI47_ARUDO